MYGVSPLGLSIVCHGRMHNSGKKFSHENNAVDNRKLQCIYIYLLMWFCIELVLT